MMFSRMLFLWLLFASSDAVPPSDLVDMLSDADRFFYGLRGNPLEVKAQLETFKWFVKRSYGLDGEDGRLIRKRSIQKKESLLRDRRGVYIVRDVSDVSTIPAKYPRDFVLISVRDDFIYLAALELSGNQVDKRGADFLVVYRVTSREKWRSVEVARVAVEDGMKLASASFDNVTYVISSEYGAYNGLPFRGSTLYTVKISEEGDASLEKIQILNVTRPVDLRFWKHLNQIYLAIGSETEIDGEKSHVSIFRWVGHNFDLVQTLPGNEVESITPFSVGSSAFLAIANRGGEFEGKSEVNSEIYRFHLESSKFIGYQKIRTRSVTDIAHFSFKDSDTAKEEHFLVIGNDSERDSPVHRTGSVVYKLEDDHFVPFQNFRLGNVLRWLPIKGSRGEFLLLAILTRDIKGYQYDGWRFAEIGLYHGESPFGSNLVSATSYDHRGLIFLVVADRNSSGNDVNMWEISFEHVNAIEKHYERVEKWCEEMKEKLSEDGLLKEEKNLYFRLNSGSPGDKMDLVETRVDCLYTERFGFLNETVADQVNRFHKKSEDLQKNLWHLAQEFGTGKGVIYRNVTGLIEIENLDVNCCPNLCCTYENLKVNQLNSEDLVWFANNVVVLNEDMHEAVLEFKEVFLDRDLTSRQINGHPAETLIDLERNILLNSKIFVNGTVVVEGDITVGSDLFRDTESARKVLGMDKSANVIGREFILKEAVVDRLELFGKLNGMELDRSGSEPDVELRENLDNLIVAALRVKGAISDGEAFLRQDFSNHFRLAIINQSVSLDQLTAEEVVVSSNAISNCSMKDIAIPRVKSFGSGSEDESRPKNSRFDGEDVVVIRGNAIARDVRHPSEEGSVLDALARVFSADSPIVQSHFRFRRIQVDCLSVDTVNTIAVTSWVTKDSEKPLKVSVDIVVTKNLEIEKRVSAEIVNDFGTTESEIGEIVFLEGKQEFAGNFSLAAIHSFGVYTNVPVDLEEEGNKTLHLNDPGVFELNKLYGKNFTVNGLVDGLSWSDLVKDAAFDNKVTFGGNTAVKGRVDVEAVHSETIESMRPKEFLEDKILWNNLTHQVRTGNLDLAVSLRTDTLRFFGSLDSCESSLFGREWLLSEGDQTVRAPAMFAGVVLRDGGYLANETLNGIDLVRMFQGAIKIDDSIRISRLVAFAEIEANNIKLNGTANGAVFKNSVTSAESNDPQIVLGEWLFNRSLAVNGSLTVEGLVSGINTSHLCSYQLIRPEGMNLIVSGSVKFMHEPKIGVEVNGMNLKRVIKRSWFGNEAVCFSNGTKRFCNVEFHNVTNVKETLNGFVVDRISEKYLSKTRGKFCESNFKFKNLLIRKSCRIRNVTVLGKVNGIHLKKWSEAVLLQDEDQIVTGHSKFSEFFVADLVSNRTLNGFDPADGIMRRDRIDAFVRGKKTFERVVSDRIISAGGALVQDIPVSDWGKRAVKQNVNFTVSSRMVFRDAEVKTRLSIKNGTLNGVNFEGRHILVEDRNQTITGEVRFASEARTKAMNISIGSGFPGIDVRTLLKEQVIRGEEIAFSSSKTFTGVLSANGASSRGYFHGIDVLPLCRRLISTKSSSKTLDDLLVHAKYMNRYLKGSQFWLDRFETVQALRSEVFAVLPYSNDGETTVSAIASNEMKLMEWDEFSENFVFRDIPLFTFRDNVTFATSCDGRFGNSTVLYVETVKERNIIESDGVTASEAEGTSCVTTFELPSPRKYCFFFGRKEGDSEIACNGVRPGDGKSMLQRLNANGTLQVSAMEANDDLYIAAINKYPVADRAENILTVYKFDKKLRLFKTSSSLPEINPVAVSTVSFGRNLHFLVLAGGHLPESVSNSIVTIFRLSKELDAFLRYQSLIVDTPIDVRFAILPSGELALYVLSSNPTKPFIVYLYRGTRGFVELTAGPSLYVGSRIRSFTDSAGRHFVLISGHDRGQILRAGFKGNSPLLGYWN